MNNLSENKIIQWFKQALKPPPVLTVSEWADQHRILSKKSASEPGKYRTSRTPYLKEIMDCLSVSHPAKVIVFKKSAQVGATECGNNWLGYIIDHAPGPIMAVQPTVDTAKRNSRLRIEPLIDETPSIKKKIASTKSRDSANTILQKDFDGGTLVLTGANSAAGLRSMPAKYLLLDEVNAYPHSVEDEGDPISLVFARSKTFSRRKAFLISTPTTKGACRISEEFEKSDKRFFHVPCPHCNEFQKLEFKNLKWPQGKPHEAGYYCEHCTAEIEEKYKSKMLSRGKWIAEGVSDTIGFFINALYSPAGWQSWKEIAKEYEDAKEELEKLKKHEKMKAFTNTVMGEAYEESGDVPEWRRIYNQREGYKIGNVPKGGLFLTAGVDVQKDRIEIEVVAWGRNKESWSVDYQTFTGNTDTELPWVELSSYIERAFETDSGAHLPISYVAVDSGYNTQHVYNFCRKYPVTRLAPVKGEDGLQMLVGQAKPVDVKLNGKTWRRGVRLFKVGVSMAKSELYGQLKMEYPLDGQAFPPGFCHFPMYGEEYFRQLTAEKVIIKRNRKNFSVMEWVKDRERNEALDCRVYARAAASIYGLDRFKSTDWDKFQMQTVAKPLQSVQTGEDSKQSEGSGSSQPKTPRKRKRESSFW